MLESPVQSKIISSWFRVSVLGLHTRNASLLVSTIHVEFQGKREYCDVGKARFDFCNAPEKIQAVEVQISLGMRFSPLRPCLK